jgi:poly(A) polymerase
VECSFSALDAYFRVAAAPPRFELHDGDMVSLVSAVDGLSFPGLPYADAVLDGPRRVLYRYSDGGHQSAYPQTRLSVMPGKHSFDARGGVYESLALKAPVPDPAPPEVVLFEAAVLTARYGYLPDPAYLSQAPANLPREYQRDLLDLVVTGRHAERGFELLARSGFISAYWPEVAELAGVIHAKDFHPEGDAWRHTMETFAHRKNPDHILSLGLLLHDTGKPDAVANGGRRFDGHSEIGERTARSLLVRLGYPRSTVDSVAYLVRYHMLPAALPRVPPTSIERILVDPLFTTLLELYRCDELSSFRGPDGYYDACAAYKAFLRNTRNPYRDSNGKRRQDSLPTNGARTL